MPKSLLTLLSADHALSGEMLAKHCLCTRAAIAKRMAHLKDMGVLIEAIPRVGYRLQHPYEWWHEGRLKPAFAQIKSLTQYHLLDHIDSTNRWMREFLAQADVHEMHVAITDFQSAGQGRRGREWLSLPGRQITASLGHVSSQGPLAWIGLAIAIGLSLAMTLRRFGWPVMLKWPNDLWLNDAKLGGILVELDAMAEGPSRLIIGYGINEALLTTEREALDRPVAALADLPVSYDRHELLAALCADAMAAITDFATAGLQPWQPLWRELDVLNGVSVQFDDHHGWQTGVARGIDEQGALLIDTSSGLTRCHSGDVSVRVV